MNIIAKKEEDAVTKCRRMEQQGIRTCQKKVANWVTILCDYFVKTKSQTHRDCIITKFVNSVNTYAHTYGHRSCVHFVNFANVSMRIARMLCEHTLLASLHEVFACVLLPFFDKYCSLMVRRER